MLPAVFARLHPRYGSPVAVVAVLTGITVVAPFFGRPALVWLVDAGSLATVVAYLLVTAAFLIIRRRHSELPRPYRVAVSALVGWLVIASTVLFILLYLPGSPSALVSPEEWARVRLWTGLVAGLAAGMRRQPGDRRVPVGDADHHPERHQRHRWRHRHGAGERGACLHEYRTGGARLSDMVRRQGLGGRCVQSADQHHVLPAPQCRARMMATPAREDDLGARLYSLAVRNQLVPGIDQLGTLRAISAETGKTVWQHDQRAMTMSLVATGGGLVFGGDANERFRAHDHETGEVLWEINLGSPVTGFPFTYAVDGRQYVAVSTGVAGTSGGLLLLTPELRPSLGKRRVVPPRHGSGAVCPRAKRLRG